MAGLPAGYEMRAAVQGDIPAILAADRAASELFRPTGLIPGMSAIPESVPADVLSRSIESGLVLVAADGEGPVGFALCQVKPPVLYLDQISVDPAHGRKGLGRALMMALFPLAEARGADAVILSTFREVPWNGPFYASLGFKEIPRRRMTDWMLEIEAMQAAELDVSKRCFMRRPVRRFALLRRRVTSDGRGATHRA